MNPTDKICLYLDYERSEIRTRKSNIVAVVLNKVQTRKNPVRN